MKVEYKDSVIGIDKEMVIDGSDYAVCLTENGVTENSNVSFALKSFAAINGCKPLTIRDIEEAYRHCGKKGKIKVITKALSVYGEHVFWNEVYCSVNNELIPVVTSNDGHDYIINYSKQTQTYLESKNIRKQNHTNNN